MLGQVETQILLADVVSIFIACFAVIVGVTIVDFLTSKASSWMKIAAYIAFLMVLIFCSKTLAEYFLVVDEFFRQLIGNYDVSDLVEPMRRLIKEITSYVTA